VIEPKSRREIASIREAGRILAEALRAIQLGVQPGVTTRSLEVIAERVVSGRGGTLLFKGYQGYPAGICVSVNEEVVHGIPGARRIQAGDLVSIDIGVRYMSYCADAAVTVGVDRISKQAKALIRTAKGALEDAIKVLHQGVRLSELSRTIQEHVESRHFSVVRSFVGHGIGRKMHEPPQIPNFVSPELLDNDVVLPVGAVLAIEPMVNAGTYDVEILDNGWTVVTKDHKLSAHFEHTVAVTEDGAEVLTLDESGRSV